MPRSSMAALRPIIEASIEAIAPDVWPDVLFRRASGDCALRLQTFGDRLDGTRRFHVLPGPMGSFRGAQWLEWNGTTGHLRDAIEVQVRYEVPTGDDGYMTFLDITATDQQLIAWAISTQVTDYWQGGAGGVAMDVAPNGTVTTTEIATEDGTVAALIIHYQYDLLTYLGED